MTHARKKVTFRVARCFRCIARAENCLFISLSVGDVREGAERTNDLAVRILERTASQLEPRAGARTSKHLQLVAVGMAIPAPLETSLRIILRVRLGEQLRRKATDQIS